MANGKEGRKMEKAIKYMMMGLSMKEILLRDRKVEKANLFIQMVLNIKVSF